MKNNEKYKQGKNAITGYYKNLKNISLSTLFSFPLPCNLEITVIINGSLLSLA